MAYRQILAPLAAAFVLNIGGCFNPDVAPMDADTDGTSGTGDSGPAMTSMTMTSPNPTSDTGMTTMGVDDTGTDTMSTDDDPTGPDLECESSADCPMPAECEVATCSAVGTCGVENADEGTACGDETDTQCNGADTCDGNGTCQENVAFDGMDCTDCDSGQCICGSGTCGDCVEFADTNLFTTPRSLVGWELTGSWGLYTVTPPSGEFDIFGDPASPAPIPFGNSVLGTDGNRRRPYPGREGERSYARTPPTELPSSITFQSWHLDEGAGLFDNKIIRVSTDDGMTWTDIISCPINPELPFCQPVSQRAPDDWDSISLDLPAPSIGQVGIIEFAYDTGDACCDFEKGWYIDVTNFATECACSADETCAPYGDACGEGVCGGNGGCNLDAAPADTPCGDDTDNECTNPDTCDGDGYCLPRHMGSNGQECLECPAGEFCGGCEAGECADCIEVQDPVTFDSNAGQDPLLGWTITTTAGGGWQRFFGIPSNEEGDPFISNMDLPMLGIDGNVLGGPDLTGEISTSQIVSSPSIVPETVTFESWHQDQGGASLDLKRIDITIDAGKNWIPLADCSAAPPLNSFPFCLLVNDRDPEAWDDIELDTSMWEGMEGQLRFSYDTVNDCCDFERGWYIDDLNFSQFCAAPNLSEFNVPCEFLNQDFCEADIACGWNGGTSECVECYNMYFGDQAGCDADPACAFDVDINRCYGANAI